MKLKTCLLQVMAAGAIALLAAACSPSAPADSAPTLPEPRQPAAPTPVPAGVVTTAKQFASAQARIETDWDDYHQNFDRWRSGLTSCSRDAAATAFRKFASGASAISGQARGLPRSSDVRDLADMLVEAAEAEEAALRRLSDQWQPGNTALLEAVAEQRSKSLSAQIAVRDGLEDLTTIDPDSEEVIKDFSKEFESILEDWEALQKEYAEIRDGQETRGAEESAEDLGNLLEGFSKLREAIKELPSSGATGGLIEDLLDALDGQAESLEDLQEQFSGAAGPASPASTAAVPPVPTPTPTPPELTIFIVPPDGEEPKPGDDPDSDKPLPPDPPAPEPPSFEDADAAAAGSGEVLADTQAEVEALLENPAAAVDIDLEKVEEFEGEYLLLVNAWDKFHADYARWRANEGGCDRAAVSQDLAGYSETLSSLAGQVRGLPRASYLRPMGASLIEAVQREQEAMRVLSYNWRPFSTDAFRAFDQERSSSRELRRQTQVGVQELLTRFGGG